MHSKEYLNYLDSEKWQNKRERKLKEANYLCDRRNDGECNGSLQVHHLHYDNLGNENLWDLAVLCEAHHILADEDRRFETWAEKKFGADWDDGEYDDPLGVWDAWESRDLDFENNYNEEDIIYD